MRYATILLLFFAQVICTGQVKHETVFKGGKVVYHTTDGRMDGAYVSYYKNGQKKAEGNIANHYRTGEWKVWDSTGQLRVHRIYSDPFTFKQVLPAFANDALIQLLNVPPYTIAYNDQGYINYFYLEERMVIWAKRVWRTVYPEHNTALFRDKQFFHTLHRLVLDSSIKAYDPVDDEYRKRFMPTADTSGLKLVGYKIKEDWFYDHDRRIVECRIIGLCPLVVKPGKTDTLDLYWLYLPEMRKHMAQMKVKEPGMPAQVKTLDDLIFYRCFTSTIIKESNMKDREIKDYTRSREEAAKEAERITLEILEKEHRIWMGVPGFWE